MLICYTHALVKHNVFHFKLSTALHGYIEHFGVPKIFILVTPLMTWALTKTSDPVSNLLAMIAQYFCTAQQYIYIMLWLYVFFQDDPDVVLTEDDFRRRRPHSNFKELSAAEKNVLRLGKTVSRAYAQVVICLLNSVFCFHRLWDYTCSCHT